MVTQVTISMYQRIGSIIILFLEHAPYTSSPSLIHPTDSYLPDPGRNAPFLPSAPSFHLSLSVDLRADLLIEIYRKCLYKAVNSPSNVGVATVDATRES
jgi:hypothetical protein